MCARADGRCRALSCVHDLQCVHVLMVFAGFSDDFGCHYWRSLLPRQERFCSVSAAHELLHALLHARAFALHACTVICSVPTRCSRCNGVYGAGRWRMSLARSHGTDVDHLESSTGACLLSASLISNALPSVNAVLRACLVPLSCRAVVKCLI